VNAVLGAWLVASTYLWPHTPAEQGQNLFVGFVAFAFALGAVLQPSLRVLNTISAVWLFAGTLILQHAVHATLWHNVALAWLFFAMSVVPSSSARADAPVTTRKEWR